MAAPGAGQRRANVELPAEPAARESSELLRDTLRGLSSRPREIPCKYLYDERGSELFDEICRLDEYYLTRAELAIMDHRVDEMAAALGPRCMVLEYGSGTSHKTEILLGALEQPVAYVPIDISCELLAESADRLRGRFPDLEIEPVCADYTSDYSLPRTRTTPERRVVYFPGSTIGNFAPDEAADFLSHVAMVVGTGGGLLIGVDLDKSAETIEAAYNDAAGVTAAFNLNLLERLNRELGADFDPRAFRHEAVYDGERGRVEMFLASREKQRVRLAGRTFHFEAGERLCTEHCHKYGVDEFAELARASGFEPDRVWLDDEKLFSVHYLRAG